MTDSTKVKVLKAIQLLGVCPNPHELQAAVGVGTHDIVHVIYSLQKQGFIRFRLTSNPPTWKHKAAKKGISQKIPTAIRITPQGEAFLAQRKD